jgi:hypothetical protein
MTILPIIIFTVLMLSLAVFSVHYYWQQHRMRQLAQETTARWLAEGREVRFHPTPVEYYGNEPLHSHSRLAATQGLLGIADRELIFIPHGYGREQAISFDLMHWIGTHPIEVSSGDGTIKTKALVVHYEALGKWYMGAWVLDWPDNIAGVLAKLTGQHNHSQREDCGPEAAECLLQDVYGQWHPAAESRHQAGVASSPFASVVVSAGHLYLAPDRLIFNRRYMIHLSQFRRIEVHERGGLLNQLNPFAENLLRIEYAVPDEPRCLVVGFLIRQAERWGKYLAERAQVPCEVREGRKKKDDD